MVPLKVDWMDRNLAAQLDCMMAASMEEMWDML